jgi:hypothetical protein
MVILAVFALNIAQPGTVLSYVGKFSFVLTVAGFAFQNRTQKADTTYGNKLEHKPSSQQKASGVTEAFLIQE